MNRQDAHKEFLKIIDERNQKAEEIIKNAKEKGIWEIGLDSNRHLFKEIDDEAKQKIKKLEKMIEK